jgi:hypothetical protein
MSQAERRCSGRQYWHELLARVEMPGGNCRLNLGKLAQYNARLKHGYCLNY